MDTPIGKRPLGKPRHRLEDNIRMDLKEIGINTRSCVDSTHDRNYWRALVNAALNLPMELVMKSSTSVSRKLQYKNCYIYRSQY